MSTQIHTPTIHRDGSNASPRASLSALSGHTLGIVLAAFMGGWHVLWSLLVLFGWAQPVIDFVFWLHFITPPYQVGAFVPARALGLIALTASLGYVFGHIIAAIWNALPPRKS